MSEWKVRENLPDAHAGAKLLGDQQSVPTVLAKPCLDGVRNREGCVVHGRDGSVAEISDVLGKAEKHESVIGVADARRCATQR